MDRILGEVGHRGHAGVMHPANRNGHDDAGNDLQPGTGDIGHHPEGSGCGNDGDQDRKQDKQHVMFGSGRDHQGGHTNIMHGGDGDAAGQSGKWNRDMGASGRCGDPESDCRKQDSDNQRQQGKPESVPHRQPEISRQNSNEMHRPDAATQHNGTGDNPGQILFAGNLFKQAIADIQGCIRGKKGNQKGCRNKRGLIADLDSLLHLSECPCMGHCHVIDHQAVLQLGDPFTCSREPHSSSGRMRIFPGTFKLPDALHSVPPALSISQATG